MGSVEKKEIAIGFVVGVLATLAGFYIYVEFISPYPLEDTLAMLKQENLYGKVLGLAAIPNLFVFFIYLKKNYSIREYSSLMMIGSTLLVAQKKNLTKVE